VRFSASIGLRLSGLSIGIPYAQAPVGSLRLKAPVVKLSPGVSTFDASQYGPGCIQSVSASLLLSRVSPFDGAPRTLPPTPRRSAKTA
jgi:hypothetical protein